MFSLYRFSLHMEIGFKNETGEELRYNPLGPEEEDEIKKYKLFIWSIKSKSTKEFV